MEKKLSTIFALIALLTGCFCAHAQSKVIYTGALCKKVQGYNGNTPVKITIEDGVITKIEMDNNQETPRYLAKATKKIFPQFIGKTVDQASKVKADGATGATYTSKAIIKNINAGLKDAKKTKKDK